MASMRLAELLVFFAFVGGSAFGAISENGPAECRGVVSENAPSSPTDLYFLPRILDPKLTFEALVDWVHREIIVRRGAPGLVVGLSGTDSVVAFLAIARAYEKAGRPERAAAVHFAGADPTWVEQELIPWLRIQAPKAVLLVDRSIDHRRDGLRWGALLEWSVVRDLETGAMRDPADRFWVVGTRNATEQALHRYSNVSSAASVQPLVHLWKSEVLQICRSLQTPQIAIDASCQSDCVCGREELPALNIPELDALLMVRTGELHPSYPTANIPAETRAQLEAYIELQLRDAGFKEQIPYLADTSLLQLKIVPYARALGRAKATLQLQDPDFRLLAILLPKILQAEDANAASDLVSTPSPNRLSWLPEALTLLSTKGLRTSQRRVMLASIFGGAQLSVTQARRLAELGGRLGFYGFSFPQWKNLTRRYSNAALVEQFGMQRHARPNDVREPKLPPSDPARDFLGVGFTWSDPEWHVEFRRAYLLCSRRTPGKTATVIIRNNSPYFGRDRLSHPVYVSWETFTPAQLNALDVATLEDASRFTPLQRILESQSLSLDEKLKRLSSVVDYLDGFNTRFNQWLRTEGSGALFEFLKEAAVYTKFDGSPSLFVGWSEANVPSWFPAGVRGLNSKLLSEIQAAGTFEGLRSGSFQDPRLILLSGEHGDFP